MALPAKKDNREVPSWRRLDGVHLASILLPVLLCLCLDPPLGQASDQAAHRDVRAWLEFNHHIGGFVVLVLAGLTWLEVLGIGQTMAVRLGWPTCLILIGLYNVIFSDRSAWPIGPSGLMESLTSPEILQHKILAIMVLTLGVIELLRRLQLVTQSAWLYLFYGLAMLTGVILLGHDFAVAPHTHSDGVTVSHILMGLLAILALVLKVLVDHGLILGRFVYLYPLFLAALGMQLLLFTESSVEVR